MCSLRNGILPSSQRRSFMGKGSYGFPGLRNVSHGRATHYISSNLKSINRKYGLTNAGYIAQRYRRNEASYKRIFLSSNPVESAKRLFRTLGRGGIQKPLKDNDGSIKGWTRTMKGGDVITYRPRRSSDGSSVVDINIKSNRPGIKSQKIHFYHKEKK